MSLLLVQMNLSVMNIHFYINDDESFIKSFLILLSSTGTKPLVPKTLRPNPNQVSIKTQRA